MPCPIGTYGLKIEVTLIVIDRTLISIDFQFKTKKNQYFSAFNGIDSNDQKDIAVMCDLEIEWIPEDYEDHQKYAACEIIQPKFQNSYEYGNSGANLSGFTMPINGLGNCV